jgi:flavodoxin
MLKYILYSAIALVAIVGAVRCFYGYRLSARNAEEMAKYFGNDIKLKKNVGKVLVVYYSLGGRTRDIAERIKAKTGADIYEIKTVEEIKNGTLLYIKSKRDLSNGTYPKLRGDMPDAGKYDIVFVGSPVWWYTVATPIMAFLERIDFQGRKVVPFSTQSSNTGSFLEDFVKMAKNADVVGYQSFNNMKKEYDKAMDNKISVWLNELPVNYIQRK